MIKYISSVQYFSSVKTDHWSTLLDNNMSVIHTVTLLVVEEASTAYFNIKTSFFNKTKFTTELKSKHYDGIKLAQINPQLNS